jgi:hypothetical protein
MRIGILYDEYEKTASFYKNGLKQGVVFSNVKSGLTPSVDVFLESTQSYVQILKVNRPLPDKEE